MKTVEFFTLEEWKEKDIKLFNKLIDLYLSQHEEIRQIILEKEFDNFKLNSSEMGLDFQIKFQDISENLLEIHNVIGKSLSKVLFLTVLELIDYDESKLEILTELINTKVISDTLIISDYKNGSYHFIIPTNNDEFKNSKEVSEILDELCELISKFIIHVINLNFLIPMDNFMQQDLIPEIFEFYMNKNNCHFSKFGQMLYEN